MATKYLDDNGLLYLWQKIRNTFVSDVAWDSANKKLVKKKKTGTNGAEESTDLVTFATVATSGSYNDLSNKPTIPSLKNVFGKVKVGSTTIEADTTQDTLEIAAGSNITLTPDATNDKVTIAATDTTYSDFTGATTSASGTHGLVPAPAQYYEQNANYKNRFLSSVGSWRHFSGDTSRQGNTYKVSLLCAEDNSASTEGLVEWSLDTASSSFAGLMSYSDKSKLDGIASGAEVNVNADWNSSSGDSQILNKPTLGTASAKNTVSSISADSNDVPTVTAVKNYVATAVTGSAAFQGTAPTTFAPTNYKASYYWVVGTAGTYVGQVCEAGDMIFATADGTTYSASDFDVIQTNLDITSITNTEIDTIVAS